MSGRENEQEPMLRTQNTDGRRRALRELLLTAADTARSGRSTLTPPMGVQGGSGGIRARLTALFTAA